MKDVGVGREGLYEEAAWTGVAYSCGKFAKTEISTVTPFFDASAYLDALTMLVSASYCSLIVWLSYRDILYTLRVSGE